MNNEDRILSLLEQMNGRLDKLEQGQSQLCADVSALKEDVAVLKTDVAVLKTDVAVLKTDVATLKEDVETIKEDAHITREATNTLLEWAEQAQVEVKIPLYKKAE